MINIATKDIWLGLQRDSHSENWYWVDGSDAIYTNWEEYSPQSDSNTRCVVMRLEPAGETTPATKKWYDDNCVDEANPKEFVCQQETAVQDACAQYTTSIHPGGGVW